MNKIKVLFELNWTRKFWDLPIIASNIRKGKSSIKIMTGGKNKIMIGKKNRTISNVNPIEHTGPIH